MISHLSAVFLGVLTTILVTEPLTQRFFRDHTMDSGFEGMMGGGTMGSMMDRLQDNLAASFRSALLVAFAAAAVTAVIASIVAARRIAQPIEQMSEATLELAEGNYDRRVPVPDVVELATLAESVNTLARSLAETEERRLRLINEVAHELRTPLTTIEGYMEGLLDGVFQPSDQIFGATAREAARLKRLAADLSLLSRADEDALELRFEPVDLAAVVADVAGSLRPLFVARDISLSVDGADAPITVRGDRDRLAQVFTNIIGNAVSYTDPGGRVEVRVDVDPDNAVVTIADTGKGIAPDELERIFERFHRVDPNLPGGTGVGLTVARSLVRRHGGEVVAHSDGPGTGSRFVVSLPRDRSS